MTNYNTRYNIMILKKYSRHCTNYNYFQKHNSAPKCFQRAGYSKMLSSLK